MGRSRRVSTLIDALNQEWPAVVGAASSAVGQWAQRHPALRGCRDLDDVLVQLRFSPDPVLYALLVEARAGSRLAARAILQSMLGKLVLMARRTTDTGVDDFTVALWCRIATYPLERRPRRIAANLALDALKGAKRLSAEGAAFTDVTLCAHGDYDEVRRARSPATLSPTALELIAAAQEAEVIADQAAAVLVSVYVDGLSSRSAAERHNTTPELVRYRCSRATGKIRQQISDVLAAA